MDYVNVPVDPVCQPIRALPEKAIDSNFHIFESQSRYPFTPDRSFTPVESTWSQYEHLMHSAGFRRGVLVHPSVYGFDLSSFKDLLGAHPQQLRGVCVLKPDTSDSEIEHLNSLGVRGVRINIIYAGGSQLEDAKRLADLIKPFGWHLQFLVDVSLKPDTPVWASRLGVPVVFDHFGHPSNFDVADPGFQNLCACVRDGVGWAKLSGAYRFAKTATHTHSVQRHVDALLGANVNSLIWGTDWPHTQIIAPMPNDGELVDDLYQWLPDAQLREQVLIANAERLYDF